MLNGLLDLPWWGDLLLLLGTTHITIVAVTLYLHRHQAHRALDLHPAVSKQTIPIARLSMVLTQ